MGLFDRIRGTEDEVEIKPRDRSQSYDFDRGSDDSGEDSSDEFILPGMDTAGSTDDNGSDTSSSGRGRREDGVDRLVEQNERIIELLEELTGADDTSDTDADVGSVL
ncbi:MAG: hypothetical protein SVY41_00165 [Candidatus Nanohaloarchaea archaeon]|nr:hypothetical protein [Candidatus Nanohaloarchaea archaeon]